MAYYQIFEDMINNLKEGEELDGSSLREKFKDKYGHGNRINMNKALKKLRRDGRVNSRKKGRKILYSKREDKE